MKEDKLKDWLAVSKIVNPLVEEYSVADLRWIVEELKVEIGIMMEDYE
jgi:hypothetical protein